MLGERTVSVDPCGPGKGRPKRVKRGTKLEIRWKQCGDLRNLLLKGAIGRDCATFDGTFKARKQPRKALHASRSTGCGDGLVDRGLGESCDVGNPCAPGEMCTTACTCELPPTTTTSTTAAPSTTSGPPMSTTTTAGATTTTTTTLPPSCGNGVVEEGEACDDANETPCDGCNSCRPDRCGDGVRCDAEEQCDDGNLVAGDGCNELCESEGSTCLTPVIGDRLVAVNIETPSPLAGVQVTLEYPQLQSSVPGTGTSSLVQGRVTYFPQPTAGPLVAAASDSDSEMTFVVFAVGPPGSEFITTGPLLAVDFDNCVPVSSNICNRAQTVIDCCNNPSDPAQFNNPNFCNGTTPSSSARRASTPTARRG